MSHIVTLDYLKELNKPFEAVSYQTWINITKEIRERMRNNQEFNYICLQNINRIAPYFGAIWNNVGDGKPCFDFINSTFNEFYYMKHVGEWYKKAVIITVWGLYELTDPVEINDIYQKVYRYSAKEIKEIEMLPHYENIKLEINKFLYLERQNINNDTYEDLYKKFIKLIIKSLMINGDFNTKDVKKYIDIIYTRFTKCFSYKKISEELSIDEDNNISIQNVIFKFVSEFKKVYLNDDDMKVLCQRFEKFYDKALETLDNTDYEKRNDRLKGIKLFQKYFITEQLGEYIN